MGEEHIDYMIMTHQLRSLNIHTTPLMIASEVSEIPHPQASSCDPLFPDYHIQRHMASSSYYRHDR